MKKILMLGMLTVGVLFTAGAGSTLASPLEKTNGFVCPVFNVNSQVGAHNPNSVEIGGGDFTILGPNVSVPTHATNGNGAGSPEGAHDSPGDSTYTAIWAGSN